MNRPRRHARKCSCGKNYFPKASDGNGVLVETNGYSVNGQLAAHWTPGKWLTRYTNDANGNLTAIAYSSGPGVSAAYDALNRIKSMSDAVGASAFTYQNFGAFMGALASEDGPWAADTVTRSYANGLPQSLVLAQPAGSWTESFGYDGLSRLTNVTSTAGTFAYTYNGVGRQIQNLSLPGGNSIAETYDDAGQLLTTALKHGATVLDSYGYAYDANGNRTSVQRAGGASVGYGYDNFGQLTGALGAEADGTLRGNENFGYQYDPAGNLAMRTNNTLIQSFTTDNANELVNITRNNDLLTVAGSMTVSNAFTVNGQAATIYRDLTYAVTNGVSLTDGLNTLTAVVNGTMTSSVRELLPVSVNLRSDANGNLIWDGLHAYDFDCANELTRVTVTNILLKAEFVYDGFGRRRIRKEYAWQSNQWKQTNEVHYVYDGMLVIQERNSNNVPLVTYTRGVDLSGSMQGAGGIGGLLARTDANGPAYYHADGNGNITMLINSNGTMQAKYLYDAFGNPLGMWGPLAQVNTIRFSSREEYLGMYDMILRWYIPNLDRWPNHDPIGENGGINLYAYVGNNPINNIDPLGLAWYDGIAALTGFGGQGTFSAAWGGFGEGWSKGGQGVVNDFSGGLFNSQNGLFYNSFDQQDKSAFGSGVKCDSAFKFGSNAGRVAEGALLAAGALQAAGYDSLFGRGGTGLLNSNPYLRIGYGWNNNIGQQVFRIAAGNKNALIHWHFDLW